MSRSPDKFYSAERPSKGSCKLPRLSRDNQKPLNRGKMVKACSVAEAARERRELMESDPIAELMREDHGR